MDCETAWICDDGCVYDVSLGCARYVYCRLEVLTRCGGVEMIEKDEAFDK